MRQLSFALLLALPLLACKPSSLTSSVDGSAKELATLRAEVERLRKENADLRLSPYALAVEVDAAMRAGNEEKAAAAYKQLSDTFPVAVETRDMRKRLDEFLAHRRAEEEAARRLASGGFKALPVTPTFTHEDLSLSLASSHVTRRWTFDSYGDGWRFMDAEKDKRLLVARVNVAAKRKEPALFGIGAYVANGDKLVRVGKARYRFARWDSYASFLGTQPDYRNDFSHSWKVPFSAGIELPEADFKRGPIYLVATREGCHQRIYERFGQPPVFYAPGPCETLKPELNAQDFKGGALTVLKRID